MKESVLSALSSYLKKELPDLLGIYCFGSYGSNAFNSESDIDLAFLCHHPISNKQRFELIQQLGLLAKRNVDLIDLHNINLVMQIQILTQENRITTIDSQACQQFEDLAFAKFLRFNELRKNLVNDIQKRGSIY